MPSRAGAISARISVEPGAALLDANSESRWGALGGAAVGVRITDLLWLEAWADAKHFRASAPVHRVATVAVLLAYAIDIGPVAPFAELGVARPELEVAPTSRRREPTTTTEIVPILGLGFDMAVFGALQLGAAVRYLPLFETSLLGSPAYTSLSGRLSLCLDCDD